MSAIPGDIDTATQPPMTVPLRHFLVGSLFLVAGAVVGAVGTLGVGPSGLAGLHLLLVGFVCVVIMGAMTQFVPVWAGVALHSRRLATAQLWLVAAGLVGFAGSLLAGRYGLLVLFGPLMLAGFWTFVYNVGRTLAAARPLDVTERHFALALVFFLALTLLGVSLAADYAVGLFGSLPVDRATVASTHATLAVFGAVLTTVYGALFQLATMFTQTDLAPLDHGLQRAETVAHPVGVLALAVGRLLSLSPLARAGGLLVVVSMLAVALVLARRLWTTQVEWTPMLSRYTVLTVGMVVWALLALPAWLADPTLPSRTLGAPGTERLLVFGVLGFVVLGTLYHIVPFIVWVHRYSDRIGFEDVPMVDDLYSDRLAVVDFWLLLGGTVSLVAHDLLALPPVVATVGGLSVVAGAVAFVANLALVLWRHSPLGLRALLVGSDDGASGSQMDSEATDSRPSQ